MDLERQYSNQSHSHYSAKSSCDGSAQKTTPRTTLRELMQLHADCELPSQNSSVSQIKTSEKEQENLEQLEAVPKQHKRWGFWKSVKGLSWSSIFKPRDTEKPQRNSKKGAFAKVTKLWKKKRTPQCERKIQQSPGTEFSCCSTWSGNEERQGNLGGNGDLEPHYLASPTCGSCEEVCTSPHRCGDGAGLLSGGGDVKLDLKTSSGESEGISKCDLVKPSDGAGLLSGFGNVKVDPKTSSGVEHDDENSCRNSADFDEKQNMEENELVVEDGDFTFDTQVVENDVNEDSMRILQQEGLTHLDVGVGKNEMCEEFNDLMLARSSYDGYAEMSTDRNASALISAEFGSPYKLSQSKIWEVFELFDVCTAEEEKLRKQSEAVPKEHKDKGRSWSSLLKPREREYKQPQGENKDKVVLPRDKQDKKSRRKNKIGVLPRDEGNKKPEWMNKHTWCFRQGNKPVLEDRIKYCT